MFYRYAVASGHFNRPVPRNMLKCKRIEDWESTAKQAGSNDSGQINHISLFSCILISLMPLSLIRRDSDETEEATAESGMILRSVPSVAVRLDVPLLNQLDPPASAARPRSHLSNDPAVQWGNGNETNSPTGSQWFPSTMKTDQKGTRTRVL